MRETRGIIATKWIIRLAIIVVAILPVYTGIMLALTPYAHIMEPMLAPKYFRFSNFIGAIQYNGFGSMVLRSIGYSLSATLGVLLAAIPGAYVLARFRFVGRRLVLFGLLMTQMMAGIVVLPSLYRLFDRLNLLNTRVAVVLTLIGVNLALSVWLLVGFFASIPHEIEEAASIDGASQIGVLSKVVLPLAAPGIAVSAVFAFINSYNNFTIPLFLLSDNDLYPFTLGLYSMINEHEKMWHFIASASVIAMIPPLLVFLTVQRYMIKGLTAGGMKG